MSNRDSVEELHLTTKREIRPGVFEFRVDDELFRRLNPEQYRRIFERDVLRSAAANATSCSTSRVVTPLKQSILELFHFRKR